ncbi:hypothetical protein I9018_22375 [Pseudomonas sp. MPFS]|uniref:hypothetical protein n=1 Tax=Pseudomonas sp. MPFS TaxID=2795724 RepID=UPI001F12A2D4|nr:hypothetical protein [Pseudomonas sp. MPFS]UMZ10223.1 hypothetical protein I9018_22375 [Pseudomonas sp. MPFS]
MINPIRVYLDSSDFSNLSCPSKKNTNSAQAFRAKLREWVEHGDIEIRYSMAHIMEAVPMDPDTIEQGRLRLDCIRELCREKVFVDPISLVTQELSGNHNISLVNDNGHWFPGMAALWTDEIVEEIVDESDPAADFPKNRLQRRIEKSKARKIAAKMKGELQEFIKEYPIKKASAISMFSRQRSGQAVAIALQSSVSDLNFLCDWYIENWNRSTEYSKAVRGAGKELSSLLTSASNEIKALHQDLVSRGTSSSEAQKQLMAHAKEIAGKAPQQMINSLSNGRLSAELMAVASLKTTPSMYVFSALLAQIFLSSVVAVRNTRKARSSDLGDLVHSMYIPYVDVFRADLATASALHNAKLDVETKIVTSLEQLMVELESLIALRKS